MEISKLIELLEEYKNRIGDIDVWCVNNDGPGDLWEDCSITKEYIEFRQHEHVLYIGCSL